MLMFSLDNLLFDHCQFTLIHGSNIPGSYAVLFFIALDFISITSHIHNWVLFLLCVSVSSFFLKLLLHWSPVAYWAPADLGSSSFSLLSFCLFILFMGLSRQEYWSGLWFPSVVDHILSDLTKPPPVHFWNSHLKTPGPDLQVRAGSWYISLLSPQNCCFT